MYNRESEEPERKNYFGWLSKRKNQQLREKIHSCKNRFREKRQAMGELSYEHGELEVSAEDPAGYVH